MGEELGDFGFGSRRPLARNGPIAVQSGMTGKHEEKDGDDAEDGNGESDSESERKYVFVHFRRNGTNYETLDEFEHIKMSAETPPILFLCIGGLTRVSDFKTYIKGGGF